MATGCPVFVYPWLGTMRKFALQVYIVNCLRDRLRNTRMAFGCPRVTSIFILTNLHIIRYSTRTNLLHLLCIWFLLDPSRPHACIIVLWNCKGSTSNTISVDWEVSGTGLYDLYVLTHVMYVYTSGWCTHTASDELHFGYPYTSETDQNIIYLC
jgi:hypothetical protein